LRTFAVDKVDKVSLLVRLHLFVIGFRNLYTHTHMYIIITYVSLLVRLQLFCHGV
jgi:hypothetical protein